MARAWSGSLTGHAAIRGGILQNTPAGKPAWPAKGPRHVEFVTGRLQANSSWARISRWVTSTPFGQRMVQPEHWLQRTCLISGGSLRTPDPGREFRSNPD